ncbi:Uncharacterized protein OBRU01_01541 [Operophtera brumata]|uniref:C2HC/C3H-type domain-containing protein n=1 Tax=Operophtera brumata TaxID=104452 RepID=A0A0L7LU24_OPEBR|nr:Uncharacterized protein OBRU01_01541 [Operophtera brumata]
MDVLSIRRDIADKARFQQKQMQEREMKIANLYEAQQARALDRVRHSPSNGVRNPPNNGISSNGSSISSPPQSVPHQPGKPIHNTDRTRKALPNGYSKVTATSNSTSRISVEKRTSKTHTSHAALPQSNGEPSTDEVDSNENNYLIENETFPDALAPAQTPRSPEPQSPRSNAGASPTKTRSTVGAHGLGAGAGGAGEACTICGRKFASDRLAKHQEICKKAHSKKRKPFDALKHRLALGLHAVTTAGFTLATLRWKQEICKKAHSKKRKPFDALKYRLALVAVVTLCSKDGSQTSTQFTLDSRSGGNISNSVRHGSSLTLSNIDLRKAHYNKTSNKKATSNQKPFNPQGTEAEPFINKLRKNTTNPSSTKVKALNSSWRQKHEDFIQAIRNAKQVQAHLARGGKQPFQQQETEARGLHPGDSQRQASAGSSGRRRLFATPSKCRLIWQEEVSNPFNSRRQKHEDFIQAIRNAKQVQAHLAGGGKLSDLPPPPPSENPDYVSCPSCGRRFNQGAAERHIPKCKNYQFNKPKPAAKRR